MTERNVELATRRKRRGWKFYWIFLVKRGNFIELIDDFNALVCSRRIDTEECISLFSYLINTLLNSSTSSRSLQGYKLRVRASRRSTLDSRQPKQLRVYIYIYIYRQDATRSDVPRRQTARKKSVSYLFTFVAIS